MNYNHFLDVLEKHGLLTSAWSGSFFLELPKCVQKEVRKCVAELAIELEGHIEERDK